MTEKKTVQAWIALGSNIDPQKNIEKELDRLSQLVTLQALSDFYRSAPFNRPEQADFINGVARIETDCPPFALKYTILRKIEEEAGRKRSDDKYAARTIDLDILLYAFERINEPGITVPDPDLALRPFLFVPLLDLEPYIQVPGMDGPLHSCCSVQKRKLLQKEWKLSKHLKERFHL